MTIVLKNRTQGFTLVELLIAMAIALVVISSLASTFVSQRKTFDAQEVVLETIQSARAATDMIASEVRMAGYDPSGAGIVGVTYSTSQLQIRADLNSDGETDGTVSPNDTNEDIIFTYVSGNMQIGRNVGSGAQPLAENIKNFTFTYWYEDPTTGLTQINSATDESKIRMIKITIEARDAKGDPNYTHPTYGDNYRTYTMTTFITPPNLGLASGTSATTTTIGTTTAPTTTVPTTSTTGPSTTTTTSTNPSSTTGPSTSTSSTTSTSTTTPTTSTNPSSTTTTTLGGGSCELSVTLTVSWAESQGGWRHIFASATVVDGPNGAVEDATVEWSINSTSQGALSHVGSGTYAATSSGTYQKESSPSVTAAATKDGCISGNGGPATP